MIEQVGTVCQSQASSGNSNRYTSKVGRDSLEVILQMKEM